MAESFLENALRRRASIDGPVPTDLVQEWVNDDDELPASYLLHPAVRGHHKECTASEADVRAVLEKKRLTLTSQISSSDFAKLAGRVQKRASSHSVVDEAPKEKLDGAQAEAVQELATLLQKPKWSGHDSLPAQFAPRLLCGSAEHAADLAALRKANVKAVLNCAPSACDDPVESYEEYGIAYAEVPAEDFEDYPLLELHLEEATKFVEAHVGADAGVNRSAALAIAMCMIRERAPLLDVVKRCWAVRPFILSNESFRQQLVLSAAAHNLLQRPDGYAANYPEADVSAGDARI